MWKVILSAAVTVSLITFALLIRPKTEGMMDEFDRGCTVHLAQAVVSATPEDAAAQLSEATRYLQARDMDKGYPTWYGNLKAWEAQLRSVPPEAPQQARIELLLAMRTSLHSGEYDWQSSHGAVHHSAGHVILPSGIAFYPRVAYWSRLHVLAGLAIPVSFLALLSTAVSFLIMKSAAARRRR